MKSQLRLVLAGLLAVASALLAPTAAVAAPPAADPLRTLGGDSPLCAHDVGATARRACERSGAVEHPYPLDRYRFDWHIDTGITKPDNTVAAAVQWLVALLWTGILYLAKAVLLVFQWAFSLDLLGAAMRPAAVALQRLHATTLGAPWFSAAMALLGIWGVWNGLLRRRTIQTAGGLAASVVMMAAALALIERPAETIGAVSRTVNEVKLGVLAGATEGTVRSPSRSLAAASERMFDTIVLRPWCAIQFADVGWCLDRAPGDSMTRAERWLRYPVGSKARDAEYRILADPDYRPGEESTFGVDPLDADDPDIADQLAGYRVRDADRPKVKMQQQDQTLLRAGLVALIAVGVAGWVALLGYLAVQSLLQGMLALVLLLGAPAMLLAPAFGDRGRSTFTAWGKRLAAAVLSGVIYALLLAIVITLAAIIGGLDATFSWMAGWLVQLIFFWGVFFKRKDLLDWLSGGTHQDAHRARLSDLYHGTRLARTAARPAVALAGAGAAANVWGARTATATLRARREDAARGLQTAARAELEGRARERLQHRYDDAHARLSGHDDAARKLPEMRRRQDKLERERDQRTTNQARRQQLAPQIGTLVKQRQALERRLIPRVEEGVLRKFIETADRNHVEQGQKFTDQQVDRQIDELRTDLPHPVDAQQHAWRTRVHRPGIPDTELAKLTSSERAALHRRIEDDLERDRALFAALPADTDRLPDRRARRAARKVIPAPVAYAQAEQHRAERLQQQRDDARKRRTGRSPDRR